MKKYFLFLALILLVFEGFAQSSERLSTLIESEQITKGQASYLPASYLGFIEETDSDAAAFTKLVERNYFSKEDTEADLIDYATLSYVYAKAFNIKGGFFYSMIPSKHYAFNELKAKGIIPSDCIPTEKVSGRDSIALFRLCSQLDSNPKNKENSGITTSRTLPIEFGGVLTNNSTVKTNSEQKFKFNQNDTASLWIKNSFIKTKEQKFYVSAQGTYSFEHDFNSASTIQFLDLDLLKFVYTKHFGVDEIYISAGRFLTYDATGSIFVQKADSIKLEYKNRDVEVAVLGAYTGLLNAKVDTMLGPDLSKQSGDSDKIYSFAEKNLVGIVFLKLPALFVNQSVALQGIGCFSFEDASYNRLYATLDISGPISSIVYYDANTTFGFTSFEKETFQIANLTKAALSVYPNFYNSSFSANLVYASGNQAGLKNFRGITSIVICDSLAQTEYSGVIKAGISGTIKPVKSVLVSGAFDTVVNAAYGNDGNAMKLQGFQFGAGTEWQVVSDFMLGLNYSQFVDIETSSNSSVKLSLKASLKF